MRDIKFRAWSKVFNRFAPEHVEYHFDGENSHLHFDCFSGNFDIDVWDFSECELMQYTGIADSKSTELCQGDICFVDGLGNCEVDICKFYGAVFKKDGCEYPVIDSIAENDSFEVIGNIYENPGLLESL